MSDGGKTSATLLRGGTVLSPGLADPVKEADVLVRDGRIVALECDPADHPDCDIVDVSGMVLMPGLVQTHVHVCQTLWRNLADDLPLMEWLKRWTWPLEAAHDASTLKASARLGMAELLLSGTTTINDMGTVAHTDVIVGEALKMGIRGRFAKVLMDRHDGPEALIEDPDKAVSEAVDMATRGGPGRDRVGFTLAPRFAVSSSMRLLELVAEASTRHGLPVHTHCAETREEVRLTVDHFGKKPLDLFEGLGLLNDRLLLAHCVITDPADHEALARNGVSVLHCPTTNLKLGSGIAPVRDMLAAGVRVTLGADGAACNNNLSMFRDARLAALLQKGLHGPECLPAMEVLSMATLQGAAALGMDDLVGSIEPGKMADILVLDPGRCESVPFHDLASAVLYSMGPANVRHVMVGGDFLVLEGGLAVADVNEIVAGATEASIRLRERAGLMRPTV